LIFIAFLYVSVTMYFSMFFDSSTVKSEQFVIEKRADKGLFWSPRYQVMTESHPNGNYVRKKQFDQLQIGDKINGYSSDEYSFFTVTDFIYDSLVLVPLIIIFTAMLLMFLNMLIFSIPVIE